MKYRHPILRNQKNFNTIYRKGSSKPSRYVVVLYRKNKAAESRVAFVASKKVGNSVQRNRARRLIREAVRTMEPNLTSGYDIIFVARSTINGKKCPEVQRSLFGTLRATGLIETQGNSNEIIHKENRKIHK